MVRFFISCLATLLCTSSFALPADVSPQTPRQAVLEMFSGNEQKFRQHLTVEVQEKLSQLLKNTAPGAAIPLQNLPRSPGQNFDAFESGPILFAFNNAEQHQRFEIRLEADDWKGDEDNMELSLHSFRSGIEEEMPVRLRFQLGLKLQDSVWRLNTLTVSANLPLGDPRILDKSWWMPQMFAGSARGDGGSQTTGDEIQISPMRAVHRITLAENLYAQHHPEVGFTCALSNLVNVGKGLDENGSYRFLNPEFAGGVYNGYRFVLQGCSGKPARAFQIVAEPVNGKGRAYCADEKRSVRFSGDGRGATCLLTGGIARQ